MSEQHRTYPTVRAVGIADVNEAWAQGLRDFRAAPGYGLAFGAFYAAGGIVVVLGAAALGLGYLAYPLAAAFALIGPFAAVGLYEVSRRLEAGLALSWGAVLGAVFQRRNSRLAWMGVVTVLFFIAWICLVRALVVLFLGTHAFPTLDDFLVALTMASNGLLFLVLGHAVGAVLSVALFALTFVSFPLLLDRDIDVVTAMLTSVRAVIASPVVAIGWAIIVVLLLVVACLPFFLGLLVVLPVLGHTTWHLYRRIVVDASTSGVHISLTVPLSGYR
ncbi:MAG TPA: DUF2189 domain-containing protein [Pseudolabrys sp.]|nr:DUF2189 domain-containing protein [Pseudolabrys sp.]